MDLPAAAQAAVFAVLGLVFGSFATACSHRLPREMPIAADRSRCPSCGAVLAPRDLLPLLSWLLSHGRCRHCGTRIPWRYPAMEAAMAGLFVVAWWRGQGDLVIAGLLSLTACGLLIVAVADLEEGIIPDAALLGLAPVAVAWRWWTGGDWMDGALGTLAGLGLTWAARKIFVLWRGKQGLGLGDVKFAGLAGLYLGLSGLGAFLMLSGILGVFLGLGWRLAGRGQVFPLGPALCVSLLLMLYWPEGVTFPQVWW